MAWERQKERGRGREIPMAGRTARVCLYLHLALLVPAAMLEDQSMIYSQLGVKLQSVS